MRRLAFLVGFGLLAAPLPAAAAVPRAPARVQVLWQGDGVIGKQVVLGWEQEGPPAAIFRVNASTVTGDPRRQPDCAGGLAVAPNDTTGPHCMVPASAAMNPMGTNTAGLSLGPNLFPPPAPLTLEVVVFGLLDNAQYTFVIGAANGEGMSAASDAVGATFGTPGAGPAAPQATTALANASPPPSQLPAAPSVSDDRIRQWATGLGISADIGRQFVAEKGRLPNDLSELNTWLSAHPSVQAGPAPTPVPQQVFVPQSPQTTYTCPAGYSLVGTRCYAPIQPQTSYAMDGSSFVGCLALMTASCFRSWARLHPGEWGSIKCGFEIYINENAGVACFAKLAGQYL